MEKQRILIVDDEDVIREVVRRTLSRLGHTVDTAGNAESALELFGDGGYDLIYTDIMMPGMSGIDLLKEIKSRDPDVEVIIMTGYAALETAIEAIREGAFDYLHKPFEDLEEITRRTQQALERQRLVRENRKLVKRLEQLNAGLKRLVVERTREINEAHEKLKNAHEDLRATYGKIDERMKGVSDELKRQLKTILTRALSMKEADMKPEERREGADAICEGLKGLHELLNRLTQARD
jgi:DNA-binding NtrC family response regulator